MQNLYDSIYELLKQNPEFVSEDGYLLKNKIIEYAYKLHENLINLLLSNDKIKEVFFKDIGTVCVFDERKFIKFINNKDFLPDNYTAFKNKVGLLDNNDNLIGNSNDVVLNRPYKDCILEFDSTSEDENRDEIFYNEILGKDQIDKLLDKKVFTNFKRHTSNGEQNLEGFNKDVNGIIKDNLVIKGNNLLALYSLVSKYEGKIKLMYWDILYNTKNDKVPYNDKFKHSTWLTMMKNRLEVARRLLSNSGTIVIQIDYNEMAYLKVLCDEIFQDGYVATITVKTSSESGTKVNANKPIKTSEYLLMYCKNKNSFNYKHPRIKLDTYDKNYSYFVVDPSKSYDKWVIKNFKDVCSEELKKNKKDLTNEDLLNFQIKYSKNIFSVRDISDSLKKMIEEQNIDKEKVYEHTTSTNKKTLLYKNGEVVFVDKKIIEEDGVKYLSKMASDIWIDIPRDGIAGEGGVVLKNGKKPEKLLHRIIDSLTEEGDIILDAYFGTGTTGAVAHKMLRRYIGIEQLDSHFDKCIERINGVINGDATGISKNVKWEGGGEFISLEMMKRNENFVDKILGSTTTNDLLSIYNEIKDSEFLSYKVDINLLEDSENDLKNLSVEELKNFLIGILDKNALYVNYSDLEDIKYNVSDEDKKLNEEFYN